MADRLTLQHLAAIKSGIDALAVASRYGPEGPYTASSLRYVSFVNGHVRLDGAETIHFAGSLDELVAQTIAGVKEERDRCAGPVDLWWRSDPMIATQPDGSVSSYVRLAFEPARTVASANSPISLAEARAKAADDATLWTPADALRSALRRIEAGEINPSRLAIHYLEAEPDKGQRHDHIVAGLTYETHLVLLEVAKQRLLNDWFR